MLSSWILFCLFFLCASKKKKIEEAVLWIPRFVFKQILKTIDIPEYCFKEELHLMKWISCFSAENLIPFILSKCQTSHQGKHNLYWEIQFQIPYVVGLMVFLIIKNISFPGEKKDILQVCSFLGLQIKTVIFKKIWLIRCDYERFHTRAYSKLQFR